MAWLEQRAGTYHLVFRFADQRFKRSLRTSNEREAQSLLEKAERRLRLIAQGDLPLDEDVDLPAYLISDGRRTKPVTVRKRMTLAVLVDEFQASLPNGAMETTSLTTTLIHLRHVERHLGARFDVSRLSQADLQKYVNSRSQEPGRRGRCVSPVTIKKELTSFSGVWTWARQAGHLEGAFPSRGLRYPKTDEKPPFQTWEEIDRQIRMGHLSELEQEDLWDCLYLTVAQAEAVLKHVRAKVTQPFVYPMLYTAAHTGARRSELLRCELRDVDLDGMTLVLRERKRVKGKRTLRSVALSKQLHSILTKWLPSQHGRYTFTKDDNPITVNEATDHLKRALAGSRWSRIRGWHVFRHSFISNCAARGIDQRIIDAWVGHQTEEMRRRYTHLFPHAQQEAMRTVFG